LTINDTRNIVIEIVLFLVCVKVQVKSNSERFLTQLCRSVVQDSSLCHYIHWTTKWCRWWKKNNGTQSYHNCWSFQNFFSCIWRFISSTA